MTLLTRAIVSHDLEGIESAITNDPSLVNVTETDWLPVRWAVSVGNVVTLARFLRVAELQHPSLEPSQLLHQYVKLLAYDEYEPITLAEAVKELWHDIYGGVENKVGGFDYAFVPSSGQAADLRFLINWCGAGSADALYQAICA